jgi:hypothetical protein
MKPRIRKFRGSYICFATGVMSREPLPTGRGASAAAAYDDWASRTKENA